MLRPAEAAEALGLSLRRLRRFAADGRLVTVRTLGGIAVTARTTSSPCSAGCTPSSKAAGVTGVSPVPWSQSSPVTNPPASGAATLSANVMPGAPEAGVALSVPPEGAEVEDEAGAVAMVAFFAEPPPQALSTTRGAPTSTATRHEHAISTHCIFRSRPASSARLAGGRPAEKGRVCQALVVAFDPCSLPDPALAFLAERHLATLSTLRADGALHVVAVGFTYDPAARLARVITGAATQKAANARRGGRAAVCQVDGGRWLSLEGPVAVTDDPERVGTAVTAYTRRYRPPRRNPTRVALEITVERVLGRVG